MTATIYELTVQNSLEERQIRRLGAAVCLLWRTLPYDTQIQLLDEASNIRISGEDIINADLRTKLVAFVESDVLRAH